MAYRRIHPGDVLFRVGLTLRQHGIHDDAVILSIENVLRQLGIDYGNSAYFPKPHPVETIEDRLRLLRAYVDLGGRYRQRKPLYRALAAEFGQPEEAQALGSYVERERRRFLDRYYTLRDPDRQPAGQEAFSRHDALKLIDTELEINDLELTQRLYLIFGTETDFAGRIGFLKIRPTS